MRANIYIVVGAGGRNSMGVKERRGDFAQWMGVVLFMMVMFVLVSSFGAGLTIVPSEVQVEPFSEEQEVVFSVINDGFEPVACSFEPTYLSSYLSPYVTLIPDTFLVKPGEQVNLRAKAHFPADLPPQMHRLVFVNRAGPDGTNESLVVLARPPGEQKVRLEVRDFLAKQESSVGGVVVISGTMANQGNTVVFATPVVMFKNQGRVVKTITYPRPFIILPGEEHPLSLRLEGSDLADGEYVGVMQVRYRADGSFLTTSENVFSFIVSSPVRVAQRSSGSWLVVVVIGLVAVSGGWWATREGLLRRKKKKHLSHSEGFSSFASVAEEVRSLREDVSTIGQEVRVLVDESESWVRKQKQRKKGV